MPEIIDKALVKNGFSLPRESARFGEINNRYINAKAGNLMKSCKALKCLYHQNRFLLIRIEQKQKSCLRSSFFDFAINF